MAMQSLHRFADLKALLDFRDAYTNEMDCYIYCKEFPKGFVVNGHVIESEKNVFLFAAKHARIEIPPLQGRSAAYLLVFSGFPENVPEGSSRVGGISPFISLSIAQSACLETVIGEVVSSQQEKRRGQFLLFLELLLAQPQLNVLSDVEHYGRRIGIAYRFIAIVQQEISNHHDVNYYADILCVSSGYLSKCVSVTLNMPAKQFIVFILMEHAEQLLRDTDNTIIEISEQLGFDSSNSFTAFFKHHKGFPPTAFRK